jgi:uncharacterized membrane protein YkoI
MENTKRLVPRWLAASALTLGLVAGGYGVASAAASGKASKAASTTKTATQRSDETPLTGDTLAKATAAALAKVPGGKVVRAETETDGNAAYEVHMTDASGAPVTVYLDKDFNVVSVDTRARGGGRHGGGGHHGGGQRSDETPLTGDSLSKASAAALAKVPGGKVVRAESDADGVAQYEVHMTNASGAPVTVYLDKDFNVVSVDTSTHGRR